MYRLAVAMLALPVLAACQPASPAVTLVVPHVDVPPAPPLWRTRIADSDIPRLEALPGDWRRLYTGLRAPIRVKTGAVLDPEAGQPHPALPPGSYRCRTLRLRPSARGGALVQPTPSGFCFISPAGEAAEDAPLGLAKQTGTDIVAGYVFPDGKRAVFLGARQRKAGANDIGYGSAGARDVVGLVERFGPFRWRLAVPGERPGSVDLYELTPVPAEGQPKG
ncbi:DUF4893 domain-containing protein [Sphingomonas sp. HT-1]|uniref:DUF4893 domain-containing protein n=1 Tax=unclassified Sphingomonas TaxID=196159 RepID=UPI000311F8F6|nr:MULTISPECIES: DUF4893 domain-containing protein [unclassified Sphingomonas]KTF67951.1 hypothetical protein ATB93_15905 [Sphingomonas sp. WG]